MEVDVASKSLAELTFVESEGSITAMHAGVVVGVAYNGGTGTLSTSVDVWPLLTERQRQQMQVIKAVAEQAVENL